MSHVDPFVLQTDTCDGCLKLISEYRLPCLTCFGGASYCSDACMAAAYPSHNAECSRTFRRVAQSNFLKQRWQQCGSRKGVPQLLRHLAESVQDSRQHIYLIRLPMEPTAKLPLNHPIKKIARTAWRELASKSLCFEAIWRSFIRLAAENADRLFVVCYAPDLSFGTLIVVGDQAHHIQCPCSVHSK